MASVPGVPRPSLAGYVIATGARFCGASRRAAAGDGGAQKVQSQYAAGGPELRPVVIRQLQDAPRQYAKTSIAFLDFLDARDRRFLARYPEEIGRITNILEEHARVRAELEKQLREL